MAESDSMYNTPPCWAVYVCGLVFKKLLADGGLSAMEERNNAKVCLHLKLNFLAVSCSVNCDYT